MFLYYQCILHSGQKSIAATLLTILKKIRFMYDTSIKLSNSEYVDDFFRKNLKTIHDHCFPLVFTEGPAYSFFCHLHQLGGKVPYKKQDIEDDITAWVSGDIDSMDKDWVNRKFDKLFTLWGNPSGVFLKPDDFYNDILRWGTSGGAPKSSLLGETYRTKWGWGFGKLLGPDGEMNPNVNLYTEAVKGSGNAKVALKEEASKTRPIITTPMDSYLRQCYLLYRWGKPKLLNSPISSGSWLPMFMSSQFKWYGCVDGQRFDHSIPKWFVIEVVRRLGGLDEHTKLVAEEEIKSMQDLKIQWNDRIWDWNGGLLSGWRITSLIGTIASWMAAQWIMEKTGTEGSLADGALGDDLILASNTVSLDKATLCKHYNEFGLRANMAKTTTGPVGEFLRKTYSDRGVEGYPALSIRSLVYANPWIESYNFEGPSELSNSWLVLYSRFLCHYTDPEFHSFIFSLAGDGLSHFFPHVSRHEWDCWLRTPVCAGGGGPLEWSDPSVWHTITYTREVSERPTQFLQVLGVLKATVSMRKTPLLSPTNLPTLKNKFDDLRRTPSAPIHAVLPKAINITRALYEWYISPEFKRTEIESILNTKLPLSLRTSSKADILSWIFGSNKDSGGVTTVCVPIEVSAQACKPIKNLTYTFSMSKRNKNLRHLGVASTLYAAHYFSNVDVVRGSW